MIRMFKNRRPKHSTATPPVTITPADRIIAAHHGKTPAEWNALPAIVKADLRESVAFEMRAAS